MQRQEVIFTQINAIPIGVFHRHALYSHRHLTPLPRKFPKKRATVAVQQTDLARTASAHLIDYIAYRTELDDGAVKHETRRPLVLAHRLMHQNQCLHDT